MAKHIKDLTGMRFGKLTVLKLDHKTQSTNKTSKKTQTFKHWLCQCDCGRQKVIAGGNLRRTDESTTTCGCAHLGKNRKLGSAFRNLLTVYKSGAKDRGLTWELTEDQFRNLTSSPCHYTGEKPHREHKTRYGETYVYNGIDRVDNAAGYTLENSVPCSFEVNMMKKALSQEKFIELCSKVAERFKNVVTNN